MVDRSNWGAKGELHREVREELEFWVNRLEEFSGQLIRHSAEVLEYYLLRVLRYWRASDRWQGL